MRYPKKKPLPKPCRNCAGQGQLMVNQYFTDECPACRGTCIDLGHPDLMLDDYGYFLDSIRWPWPTGGRAAGVSG